MTDDFIKDYSQDLYLEIFELIGRYSDHTLRMHLNNERIQILTKDWSDREHLNCHGYVLLDDTVLVEYRDGNWAGSEIVDYGEEVHIPHEFPKDVIRQINLNRILKRNI